MLAELLNILLVLAGALSVGMGVKGFLVSSNFIDGGITGVSMLLAQTTGISLAYLIPVVNLPFIFLAYKLLGKVFALRSVIGISVLSLILSVVSYPDVTPDPLLTAVFGGLLIGAGIGLAIRGGAVLDGTEIAALLISKKIQILKVGDVILGFNVVLFVAAISAIGVNAALYSVLTYFAAAKTLDFVLYGIDEYAAMTIISTESAKIKDALVDRLGRGVTVYKGQGGATGVAHEILQLVLTRLEIARVRAIVQEFDTAALVFYHPLAGAEGGMVKKRNH